MPESRITCVACPMGCEIRVEREDGQIKRIRGFRCKRGKMYAEEEFRNPSRILTATVLVEGGILPLVPVKSKRPLPKDILKQAMVKLAGVTVKAPVRMGDTVLPNVLATKIDIVATRDLAFQRPLNERS